VAKYEKLISNRSEMAARFNAKCKLPATLRQRLEEIKIRSETEVIVCARRFFDAEATFSDIPSTLNKKDEEALYKRIH